MAKRSVRRQDQLSKDDRKVIRSLSRNNVELTLAGLKNFISSQKWVGLTNRYAEDTIAKIKADTKAKKIKKPKDLAQYIAASSLLHCADGWSYLGKAVLCLLLGDPHRSRHLAYYAELRAAMSLLASEGVGVFDNKHFVIDGVNSVGRLHGGSQPSTHRFTWKCLEYWASLKSSGDLFSEIVRPYGRSLDDWLSPIGGGKIILPQARSWFRQWGMDLRALPEDRDARNVSSYRPDGIPIVWETNGAQALKFARDLWSALEPTPSSRFEMIDRQVLRLSLESVFTSRTGRDIQSNFAQFEQFISSIVAHQALSPEVSAEWSGYMTRKVSEHDFAIFKLSKEDPFSNESGHAAVISRATLLLRVAAGATARLFDSASYTTESIMFWWRLLGKGRGLWDDVMGADDLLDLWADIEDLLKEVADFQANVSEDNQTFFRITNGLGETVFRLGECERVAIWSATPN